ncbi:thioredoxin family protein [Fulvimarina sp. MAC8]|uniref:thioredoxin family protein n=1 Tax=Fulvimarina sp. MAC8 TaxID=3162874 RepID=UPI0032EE821E
MAAHPPVCDFGWKAVDAELPGVDGATHRLFDLKGENGLLVVFICNHCPYVKAITDRLVRDARELKAVGVETVAICSNDAENYPEDSFENMIRFAEESGFPFHYLHDADQSVAKAYGAVCTPDFFGFNGNLELQYRGRMDEAGARKPTGNEPRELFAAMKQVAETGKGPREQVPSMGCSIKWKHAA